MRKGMNKGILMLTILLCMVIIITGCGSSESKVTSKKDSLGKVNAKNNNEEDGDIITNTFGASESSDNTDDTETAISISTKPTNIIDLSNIWEAYYDENKDAINNYDGMLLELILPATCFITGVQYEMFNLMNEDGRYEGVLMLSGYDGYIEKKGAELTFGYEYLRKENGFAPNMLAGDKLVENGNCNLDEVYYYVESYEERDGSKIDREISEFKQEEDGSMSCFYLEGNNLNISNEESLQTTFLYIRNGKGLFEFVIAKAELGTEFEILSLKDHNDMTKAQAITLFEGAGFTIDKTGEVIDGVLVID